MGVPHPRSGPVLPRGIAASQACRCRGDGSGTPGGIRRKGEKPPLFRAYGPEDLAEANTGGRAYALPGRRL